MGILLSCVEKQLLLLCTNKNTCYFDIVGDKQAKVVSVPDGHTLVVAMKPTLFSKPRLYDVRLLYYDAPKNETAIHVLASLVLNRVITLECQGYDKHGRILADAKIPCTSTYISERMLALGCGPYGGGTKVYTMPNKNCI